MSAAAETTPAATVRAASGRVGRWPWLVVFGVALALRLWGLGAQNLWYDEQLTVGVARAPWSEFLRQLEAESNKPPLYFVLMHGWLAGGSSDGWIRLPGAVLGALTCVLAAALGMRLFGRAIGWLAGLALAVAPLHVYYSQEARMYALLGLTGTAAMLCTQRFCETQRWRDAWLHLGCAVLSCYTFTYGIFILPFSCLMGLAFRPRISLKALLVLWGANVVAAGLFCLWVPRLLASMHTGTGLSMLVRGPVYQAAGYAFYTLGFGTTLGPTTSQLRVAGSRIFTEDPLAGGIFLLGALVAAGVVLAGLWLLWTRNRNAFWFGALGLLCFWGGPAVLNVLNPGIPYNARYALLALIPFSVVATGLLVHGTGAGRWILGGLFLAGMAGSLGNHYFDPRHARDDLRSAAQLLRTLQPAPAQVIVCADYLAPCVAYYEPGPVRLRPLRLRPDQTPEDAWRPLQAELAGSGDFGLIYVRPDHGDPQRVLPGWLRSRHRLKLERSWTGVSFYLFAAEPP